MNEKETELFLTVKQHLEQYPMMQPQDVMKLLYQRNYGPEHMVDGSRSLHALQVEAQDVVMDENAPLFTPIGNAYVRLNLNRALHVWKPLSSTTPNKNRLTKRFFKCFTLVFWKRH